MSFWVIFSKKYLKNKAASSVKQFQIILDTTELTRNFKIGLLNNFNRIERNVNYLIDSLSIIRNQITSRLVTQRQKLKTLEILAGFVAFHWLSYCYRRSLRYLNFFSINISKVYIQAQIRLILKADYYPSNNYNV